MAFCLSLGDGALNYYPRIGVFAIAIEYETFFDTFIPKAMLMVHYMQEGLHLMADNGLTRVEVDVVYDPA